MIDAVTWHIGVLFLRLYTPYAQSLKDKRMDGVEISEQHMKFL